LLKDLKTRAKFYDKNLFLIPKREDAIEFALKRAKYRDDMVVFLGKGHEKQSKGPTAFIRGMKLKLFGKALQKILK